MILLYNWKIYLTFLCSFSFIICNGQFPASSIQKKPIFDANCGDSNVIPGLQSLISYGSSISSEEWPWMAALFHGSRYICGGTIEHIESNFITSFENTLLILISVSNKLILTSAHCILDKNEKNSKQANQLFFLVGTNNLNAYNEQDFQLLPISKVIMHPDWDATLLSYDGDIAIAVLDKFVVFSDSIKPICLPSTTDSMLNGVKGAVAGWGLMENGSLSNELKLAQLSVVDTTICIQTESFFAYVMTSRTFCTEFSKSGPCKGDSGSCYAQKINNKWTLFGIVSFTVSNTCHEEHHIGYTDVSKYVSWIEETAEILKKEANKDFSNNTEHDSERLCGQHNEKLAKVAPWTASLYNDGVLYCDGILISKSAIITHGRCFKDKLQKFYAILGDQNHASLKVVASNFIRHPEFKKTGVGSFRNNIALILLNKPVEFNDFIQPICMFNQATEDTSFTSAMALEYEYEDRKGVVGYRSYDVSDQFRPTGSESVDIRFNVNIADIGYGLIVAADNRWNLWGFQLQAVGSKRDTLKFLNIKDYYEWIETQISS